MRGTVAVAQFRALGENVRAGRYFENADDDQ
jgi:hypothetical protein